ncbi:MAG: septum formation protein Maf [Bacteroidales bacterium]|nr:septum formation protein Maf [Bacteroidales bacterium]
MQLSDLFSYTIVLNSSSPRRKQLLTDLGFKIKQVKTSVDEVYPKDTPVFDIPAYLSVQKADAYKEILSDKEILLCSDTMVFLGEAPLGKPIEKQEACNMLKHLSNNVHTVVSACCLRHKTKERVFSQTTKVRFKPLSMEEIEYYVQKYSPLDKAGAYGIQEWIGMIGIESIEGDFYNVMGLPTQRLFEQLLSITSL